MTHTLIYAHRGANHEAAENTRTAFERALAYPIDGIETDIQLSRDGVPVLWHDSDLGKLCLPGHRIDDYDYRELAGMDFAAHFAGAAPESVMTLAAFVKAYRARCRLLLEIKHQEEEQAARQALKVRMTLARAGAADGRVWVSSFHLGSLIHAHSIAPDFPLVLNLEPWHSADDANRLLEGQPFLHGLCIHISTLDVRMMEVVRTRGKAIAVYTCNSETEIRQALRSGVDVLISDLPQKALRMRDGHRQSAPDDMKSGACD